MKIPDFIGGESDIGYQSPITLIAGKIEMKMENDTLQAIQRYGIDVNKEELLKALEYDRGQYEKGVNDTKDVLMPLCKYRGKCMSHPEVSREYYAYCDLYQEDCNCQCLWRMPNA